MSFETKIIIKSIYELIDSSKDLEEFKKKFVRIANVEGVIDDSAKKPDPPES